MNKKQIGIFILLSMLSVSLFSQTPTLKDILWLYIENIETDIYDNYGILNLTHDISRRFLFQYFQDDGIERKIVKNDEVYFYSLDTNSFGYYEKRHSKDLPSTKITYDNDGYIEQKYDKNKQLKYTFEFKFKEGNDSLDVFLIKSPFGNANGGIGYRRENTEIPEYRIIKHGNTFDIYQYDKAQLKTQIIFENNTIAIKEYSWEGLDFKANNLSETKYAITEFDKNGMYLLMTKSHGSERDRTELRFENDILYRIYYYKEKDFMEKEFTENELFRTKIIRQFDKNGNLIEQKEISDFNPLNKFNERNITILPCDIEGNVLYSVEDLAVNSTKNTKINEPAILKYRPLILIGISALIILSIVLVLLKKRKHNE